MSRRPGIVTSHFVRADGRWAKTRSPNAQPDVITAEVRLHWPYLAPQKEVIAALGAVAGKALAEVVEKFGGDADATLSLLDAAAEVPPPEEDR